MTISAADDIMRKFDKAYPAVKLYHERIVKTTREKGCVETWYGRKRWLPGIWLRQPEAERQAINTPVQGTAADILKGCIIYIDEVMRGYDAHFLFPVHDEIVMEVRKEQAEEVAERVRKMTEWVEICRLPVEVSWGDTWR